MVLKHFLIIASCSLFLFACGGSDGNNVSDTDSEIPSSAAPTLPTVDAYLLADTETLLSEISSQLQGLTIDDFFAQAYLLTSQRNHEGMISDGVFDELNSATVQLNNIADNFSLQSSAIYTVILDQLQSYERESLTKKQQVSYDVYEADLKAKIEWISYLDYEYPATYGFFGWPGSTETFFTQAFTVSDKSQAEIYLALLNQVGRRFTQIEELLEARKAKGVIEPAVTLSYSQGLVQNMANKAVTSTSYYQSFATQISTLSNISETDKTTLIETLKLTIEKRVLPAYKSLTQQMTDLVKEAPQNIGFGQFEGGKDFYDFTLRFYTSSDLSSDQIHDLGLEELARIHAEMRALFDQLGYPQNESLSSLYSRVDTDAGVIPASQTKSTYEELITQAYTELPSLFETLPQQEVIVVGGSSGGYYIAGSDDGSRPGAFYANTTQNSPYTTMPTLAYHEAVPGHHLQIALANELNLPLFRKKSNFTSFIEGWALYAERLAKDAGWYEHDIYGDLGRLQFEAMRAARLVVDTGIHNKGWTYDEANQFHISNVGFSGAITRYSVWPGQATAYTTGMLKILALRQQAKDQLAELYNIKEFHSAVIGNGSMPLNVLQTVVDNYIAEKLSN